MSHQVVDLLIASGIYLFDPICRWIELVGAWNTTWAAAQAHLQSALTAMEAQSEQTRLQATRQGSGGAWVESRVNPPGVQG